MVGEQRHRDEIFDLLERQPRQGKPPEHAPVIALHTDEPENVRKHAQCALDVTPGCALGAVRQDQTPGIGGADLVLVVAEQRCGLVGDAHALAPHRDHFVVGHAKDYIRFEIFVVLDQPAFAFEAIPQRRARQRLQQVHGQQWNLRLLDKLLQEAAGVGRVGVETDDHARHNLHAEAVQGLHGTDDRHHHVVILRDRLQRRGIGRLDAAEDGRERRLAHQLEDFRRLGDVERRLARQQQRIAVALLPLDQVRQHLAHGALVGDEIVVDEIDRGRQSAGHELVEFGAHLLGRLVSRDAAVERGDAAELALARAAAGELDAAEEIAVDLRHIIGRNREFGQLASDIRGETTWRGGRATSCSSQANNSSVASPSSPTCR